ncbi:hypothetical protein HGRIS_000991 [Hohenbuehelia grisea]|uniref:Proteophosphoglycan ppg4 n=1 Tax=Hohenbuehelia grisea TaxID=104357 RepID=A0ABR3IQI3_9AGAR
MTFPTPVGGASLPADFAPSILFAVLYGCLVPVLLWRTFHRRSRNLLTLGSITFSIERIVVFALRASQANSDSQRQSSGLLTYLQLSFGMGYLSIAQDVVKLVRCLIVNASFGTKTAFQSPAVQGARGAASKSDAERASKPAWSLLASSPASYEEIIEKNPIAEVARAGAPFVEDHPRHRAGARRFGDLGGLVFFAAIIPGVIANSGFGKLLSDESKADQVMSLRYVSTAVAFALILVTMGVVVWANMRMARISQPATKIIQIISLCMCIVSVYRLSVMFNRTDSLTSTAPGALNSPSAKALFYIFHIFPEWLSIALMFGCNIREICGTGPFGDWRSHDETEKEKEKREKKEARKKEALVNAA